MLISAREGFRPGPVAAAFGAGTAALLVFWSPLGPGSLGTAQLVAAAIGFVGGLVIHEAIHMLMWVVAGGSPKVRYGTVGDGPRTLFVIETTGMSVNRFWLTCILAGPYLAGVIFTGGFWFTGVTLPATAAAAVGAGTFILIAGASADLKILLDAYATPMGTRFIDTVEGFQTR